MVYCYLLLHMFSSYICFPLTDYSNVTAQPNSFYTTYEYSAVNFSCSDYYSYSVSDCSFATTSDYVCQSHQYDAYLTCAIGMSYTWCFKNVYYNAFSYIQQFFSQCVCVCVKYCACLSEASVQFKLCFHIHFAHVLTVSSFVLKK